jgi:hypothetical protein
MRSYLKLGYLLLKRAVWGRIYRYSEKNYLNAKTEIISLSSKMEMAQ